MAYVPLLPARLEFNPDGVPWSSAYGDVYHAAAGGPAQARHVFLAGNRLPERWQARDHFTILETGFGTGLNFLATWAAWRSDPHACRRLHYLSVERHPFTGADLARLHGAWPEFAQLAAELRAAWPTLTPGFHRLELDAGRVQLTLLLGDATSLLAKLRAEVDAFYLDGFAPDRNPELWSPGLIRRLGQLARWGASVATWSVAVPVRQLLAEAGFRVDQSPGFGGKKAMLVGRFLLEQSRGSPPLREALVLGAGVAGTTVCERLARRGWQITLIDRRPGPGQAASGNLAGIQMPMVSRDDNIASRLSRAAYLYGLRTWHSPAMRAAGACLASCGVMQFARDPAQEALMRGTADTLALPAEYLEFLDAAAATARLGHAAPAGGWWFGQGGWAHPPSLCRAALELAGKPVSHHFDTSVRTLRRVGEVWQALAEDGTLIGEAPHVILANGAEVTALAQAARLPIRAVRGQVSLIAEGRLPRLSACLCRDGYATPAVNGWHAVGASYDLDDNPQPRESCAADNLVRLGGLLPDLDRRELLDGLGHRVGFRPVAPDRLPLAGTLPDWDALPTDTATRLADMPRQTGLHGLLGYASRGLVWSAMLAETLACQLEGEPLPMEADLLDAVDPARFPLRALRKGR